MYRSEEGCELSQCGREEGRGKREVDRSKRDIIREAVNYEEKDRMDICTFIDTAF